MAGFDDLLPEALPYMAVEFVWGTAGTTWELPYDLDDNAGAPVDLSTGFTATWNLYDSDGAAVISTGKTVTEGPTGVLVEVTPAGTEDLPAGTYFHELVIVRASDGATLMGVGSGDSKFYVKRKAAA